MNSFKKKQRILKKSDFDYVFSLANKVVTHNLIVLYRKNSLDCARLGLALSKKSIRKAHDRNRVKRLIRESFRLSQLPCVDIVVLAKPGVSTVEKSTITANLGHAWKKLSVSQNT